jgi:hypothetical protein
VLDQPETDRGGAALREIEVVSRASLGFSMADELHAKSLVGLKRAQKLLQDRFARRQGLVLVGGEVDIELHAPRGPGKASPTRFVAESRTLRLLATPMPLQPSRESTAIQ